MFPHVCACSMVVEYYCRAKPLQPAEWKQMLLRAQPLDLPSAGGATAAAADTSQLMQAAAAQPSRMDDGAATAAGAEGGASRCSSGSWRSLGGGQAPVRSPMEAGRQRLDSDAASQSGTSQSGSCGGGAVVLDVRNGYEWDAGHFQGAVRPAEARPALAPSRSSASLPLIVYCCHTSDVAGLVRMRCSKCAWKAQAGGRPQPCER
jgi:hypothetical protein